MAKRLGDIATGEALLNVLSSPNVMDSNLESANIVDVIDRVATAIFRLAEANNRIAAAIEEQGLN